ncbi:RNA polymerase sigma factor [Catenulispora pinisilvae]|uniref:RNA polymerase sigma factor n=1 Tax=Catenulispora pinisilvae TaxID=2705253 RepID=UPI0018917F0D|nr:RNA polymerase sigma factor [Catenulispora pinisilvae]
MFRDHVETDRHLWDRVQADDASAYETIFRRHVTAVHNFCAHRVGSYDVADDLTSTVFLEAWRCRRRLSVAAAGASPLLFGIAKNVCSQHLRRSKRQLLAIRRAPVESISLDHSSQVAEDVDNEKDLLAMRDALADLPADQRAVIELCLIGGLGVDAAAEDLKIPAGTVKSRLSRGRARLAVSLAEINASRTE